MLANIEGGAPKFVLVVTSQNPSTSRHCRYIQGLCSRRDLSTTAKYATLAIIEGPSSLSSRVIILEQRRIADVDDRVTVYSHMT